MEDFPGIFLRNCRNLRVVLLLQMTPVFILGHLKHVKGHFGPKIITKIFALLFILLAQIVFLTRKVVNVVGIFNFTTRRVFGAGSHAADYYVAWHVSAGEGELR